MPGEVVGNLTENEMGTTEAIAKSIYQHRITKAIEHLLGMVEGIIVDNHLHELEIKMLSTWIAANQEACSTWPASVIAYKVQEILSDGVITDTEKTHLLSVLSTLASNNFADTGSATPEVSKLPINDCVSIDIKNAGVCLTGEFIFGTRAACERLILKCGGMPLDNVSKKADILIIGTKVSPDWAHTNFGRKIQKAVELQDKGHPIEIISEQRWLDSVN